MFDYKGLKGNFKFLIHEIRTQVELSFNALNQWSAQIEEKAKQRDDYIDSLKAVIKKKSYTQISKAGPDEKRHVVAMMSMNAITDNLEKIGDFCVHIIDQIHYLSNPDFFKRFDFKAYYDEIFEALDLIEDGLFNADVKYAIKICRTEYRIDELYKIDFDQIRAELKESSETDNLLTSMFILRYLERIGDSLLNIGEALISFVIGNKMRLHQYIALKESLDIDDTEVIFETVGGETKSGCKIGKAVVPNFERKSSEVIFKEGKKRKLQEEVETLQKWNDIAPGLAPKVIRFHTHGTNASMLQEFIAGHNFQEILLTQDTGLMKESLFGIIDTVSNLWEKTKIAEPTAGNYIGQLKKRLPDVLKIHPNYNDEAVKIGKMKKPSIKSLISKAEKIESQLKAPFSVFIHGDFNNDNIIYDYNTGKVHFIDLHRSKYTDYIQDVSVFLVSNFRMPVFDQQLRKRIDFTIQAYYEFAKEFALKHQDNTFDARLALAIVRNFMTSTRFELREQFAKEMYMRSVFLLEKLYDHKDKDWETFSFSLAVFDY